MRYYLLNLYLGRVCLAIALDALCVAAAAALSWWILSPPFAPGAYASAAALGVALAFGVLYYAGAYGLTVLGSGRRTLESALASMGLLSALGLATTLALGLPAAVVAPLAHTAGLWFPLLLAGRLAFRSLSSLRRFSQRLLVIGTSDLGVAIAEAVRERPNLGSELVGFLSDEFMDEGGSCAGYPVLGKVHEIEKIVERFAIGRVVVASKSRGEYFPAEELLALKLRGTRVESGVSFYERVTGRIYLRGLRSSYLIFSDGFHSRRPLSAAAKRALDVAVAALGMLLAAPVVALCALLVRLDSRGPAFYRQERVGQDGRPFAVWKLRSMVDRAEEESGPRFSASGDARITRVGRILRKARLDELPQLWNVFRGDMSLVGPRPERPEFIDELSARYPYFRLRSVLKPGVTGWAQVRYGYVNDPAGFEHKLALDLYYMKYRSLVMDLLILWKTAKTVVLLHGT
jgi:exopolysaccharide biosynthesis polyprenyl glycosylphosphotransferase